MHQRLLLSFLGDPVYMMFFRKLLNNVFDYTWDFKSPSHLCCILCFVIPCLSNCIHSVKLFSALKLRFFLNK